MNKFRSEDALSPPSSGDRIPSAGSESGEPPEIRRGTSPVKKPRGGLVHSIVQNLSKTSPDLETATHARKGGKPRSEQNRSDRPALGALEEFSCYIGKVKAEHFSVHSERKFDAPNSSKMFISAQLTHLQENLHSIKTMLGKTSKYSSISFSGSDKIKELTAEIEELRKQGIDISLYKNSIISGVSTVEAELLYARALCAKAGRQLSSCEVEETVLPYLDLVGDYLLALAIHTLYQASKEPMRWNPDKKKAMHA